MDVPAAHTIIVGAGAAGAVIAARLTEHSDLDVLLLEAGPDYPPEVPLPADLADGTRNSFTSHDWAFMHRPSHVMPRIPLPRGRVVGGSSAVNTCIGLRGQPEDYDEWGLDGWSWDEVLPAFNRLETDLDFGDEPWHGSDGPLPLRRHPVEELVPWQQAFLEACDELGFPACADTNRPDTTGWSCHAMNKLDGRRISAAEAWLTAEVRQRDNLRIQPHTTVSRVVVEGGRVQGVEVVRNGRTSRIAAHRVVLCGGAISTPGILLRSGIGPRADLARLGVDPVQPNAFVGTQLLDHPGNALFFLPTRHLPVDRADPLIQTVLRTKLGKGSERNDVQLQAGSTVPTKWGTIRGVSLMVSVCKARSVGRLVYTSASPTAKPVVDSRLYSDPYDLDLAVEGLRLCARLSESAAMGRLVHPAFPGRLLPRSRRLLRRWTPRFCDSGYHPCGTVPMGKAVDARGRFDGIEGLRVADASLFPTVPSSNTHLPTLMVGEQFGQWLADDRT